MSRMTAHERKKISEPAQEPGAGSRAPDLAPNVELENVELEIEIPHSGVNLEGKILRSHYPATDLIDAATHDLHTPLNVIIGMCHLLERYPEPLSAKQKDAVDRIERNAHALLKSVNELLTRLRNEKSH